MKEKRWELLLKAFIWGVIGTFVALEIWQPLFWVGSLVGFVGGYLSHDFATVRRAIPQVFRAASVYLSNVEAWKNGFAAFLCGGLFYFDLFAVFLSPLFVSENWWWVPLIIFAGASIIFLMAFWETVSPGFATFFEREEMYRFAVLLLPPVLFVYTLPRYVLRPIGKFVVRFSRELFMRIHTNDRLIIGSYTALGVTIGWLAGSVWVGGFTAALLGKFLGQELIAKRLRMQEG